VPALATAAAPAQAAALVVLATAARTASPSGPLVAQDAVGLVPLERWDIELDPAAAASARCVLKGERLQLTVVVESAIAYTSGDMHAGQQARVPACLCSCQ
jgi:hypothetical protein